MEKEFTIGEMARRAGVNLQTIRYYERKGLLFPVGRKESGYRLYDEDTLKRLLFIRHAKELGFTLKECGELLDLGSGPNVDCDTVRRRAEIKLKDVEGKIKSLESVRSVLKELIRACRKRMPAEQCPILKSIEEGGE